MKFVKKTDCTIKNGYVVANGEAICLPYAVGDCLNDLSYKYQAAEYNKENAPVARKEPKPFNPKYKYEDYHGAVVEPETPALDKAVEDALAVANDIKKCATADKMNDLLDGFKPLVLFITEDEFLMRDDSVRRLGIPEDWNIFEWTISDFMEKIEFIAANGSEPFNAQKANDVYAEAGLAF